jgi:hypothetical protein
LGGIQETKVTAALATPTLLWTSTGSLSSVALAFMPRKVIFVSCGSGVVDHRMIDTVNVFLTPRIAVLSSIETWSLPTTNGVTQVS